MFSPIRNYFTRTFVALDVPDYRILWYGTLFSFLGMQMQIVSRAFLAYDLTDSNSALGAVMLAFGVPTLFLTLWGGVIADRLPKRRTLLVTQTIIALNSAWLAFAIAFGVVEFWMLIASGFIQGVAFSFNGPTRQAFVSDLVGKDRIGNAIVLQQLSMNSTRVFGPAIAGVFIGIWFIGMAGTYFFMTAGFFIATWTTWKLPPGNPSPREEQTSPMEDLKDGISYVRGRASVQLLLLTVFALTVFAFPFQSFLASMAEEAYGQGSGLALGALSSAQAIGAVIATIAIAGIAGSKRAWGSQPLFAIGFGLSLMLFAMAPTYALGLIAMAVLGAFAAGFQSLNNSLSLELSHQEYHGRVQSLNMIAWSLFGLASMPIGIVADSIGIRATLLGMGGISVLLVLGLRLVGRWTGADEDRFVSTEGRSSRRLREPVAEAIPAEARR